MTPTKRQKPTKRKTPTKRTDRGGAVRRKTGLPENGSSPMDSSAAAGSAKERLAGASLNEPEESESIFPGNEDTARTQEEVLEPDDNLVVDELEEPEESAPAFPSDEDAARTQEDASELDDDLVVDEPGGAASDEADGTSKPEFSLRHLPVRKKASRWVSASFVLRIVVALVAAAIIVCFAAFAWDRWFRYDDAADLVGTWRAEGGETSFAITETEIELASDATLSYTIDPFSKTISYTLGYVEGSGRYRFSFDRTQLAIVDGGSDFWLMTMSDDMAYAIQCLWAALTGNSAPELATGDNAIVLTKESSSSADASESASEETALDESEIET